MSLAGVRSNRGDAYQTLVALDWAISMISDSNLAALEVDSTLLGEAAVPVQVDDVVVHFAAEKKTYCQCKKNETDFEAWAVPTLRHELVKAAQLLKANPTGSASFYSASPFGELAKLREYAVSQAASAAYLHGLSRELLGVHESLRILFEEAGVPGEFVFDFLVRTTFETISFERLESSQRTRLAMYVSGEQRAYDALWRAVDRLGSRLHDGSGVSASGHLLTREDILRIVESSGSVITPQRAQEEIRSALEKLSRVGRNWRREIRGRRLTRQATATITNAVRAGTRSILLTSEPGAGKTCTLLDAFEDLSTSATLQAVYVQCRSFADAPTVQDREALGYPSDFVGSVARLAESVRVVVFFDSLDVLSLSREHGALAFFLSQIDRLLVTCNVVIVAASRAFDSKYDARLSHRTWGLSIELCELEWSAEVSPLLLEWGLQEGELGAETRALLTNPRNLSIFSDMLLRDFISAGKTQQDLTREYLHVCVQSVPALGDAAVGCLERIAQAMMANRCLEVSRERAALPIEMENGLRSAAIIQLTAAGNIEFTHQTLLDVLSITATEKTGGTFSSFVTTIPPVPFVRPAIRAYVLYLAHTNRISLRRHMRAILGGATPHHIKRLIVETLADTAPQGDDWPFLSWLRQYTSLFDALLARTATLDWQRFWLSHLVPVAIAMREPAPLLTLAHKAGSFLEADPTGTLSFWNSLLDLDWIESSHLAMNIGFRVSEHACKSTVSLDSVLQKLLLLPRRDHDSLGSALMRAAASGNASDDLLWRYIAGEVDDASLQVYDHEKKIRCEPHTFEKGGVLANRMRASERLLNLAVDAVEGWHHVIAQRHGRDAAWITSFLRSTSYKDAHTKYDIADLSAGDTLFRAVEAGVLERARQNGAWWTSNAARLASSREGAFRFWAVEALTENPKLDPALAASLGCDPAMLAGALSFETGEMLRQTMQHMSEDQQARICAAIEALPVSHDRFADYLLREKAQLASAVPGHLRTFALHQVIEDARRRLGVLVRQPRIDSAGGTVHPPFGYERILEVSDPSLLRLLQHYAFPDELTRTWGEFIGGARDVGNQLREAASRAPVRFLHLLAQEWRHIPDVFRDDVLAGARAYLSHLHGGLQYDKERWKPCEDLNPESLATLILEEIERHPAAWDRSRVASDALEAVSHVLALGEAERFAFQLMPFLSAENPRSTGDLLTTAINSARGNAGDAAMVLVTRVLEAGGSVPDLLLSATRQFAADANEPVRAVILRRLPYLTSIHPDLGWDLFARCTADASPSLWRLAEPCLYYAYHKQFEIVRDALGRILDAVLGRAEEDSEDGDEELSALSTWGRISALAALSGHISFQEFLKELSYMDRAQAWDGASSVWIANAHLAEHRQHCLDGLLSALQSASVMLSTAKKMERIFDCEAAPPLMVGSELVRLMFVGLRSSPDQRSNYHPHWFTTWIAETAKSDPELALLSLEELSQFLADTGQVFYDYRSAIPRALTELFREAEERELEDTGALLLRVIAAQDRLLNIGVHGIDEWLTAAERP